MFESLVAASSAASSPPAASATADTTLYNQPTGPLIVCRYFMTGRCSKGAACRFYHDPAAGRTIVASNPSGYGGAQLLPTQMGTPTVEEMTTHSGTLPTAESAHLVPTEHAIAPTARGTRSTSESVTLATSPHTADVASCASSGVGQAVEVEKYVSVNLTDENGRVTRVQLGLTSSFQKVVETYSACYGIPATDMRLMLDNVPILPTDTAEDLGLGVDETIDLCIVIANDGDAQGIALAGPDRGDGRARSSADGEDLQNEFMVSVQMQGVEILSMQVTSDTLVSHVLDTVSAKVGEEPTGLRLSTMGQRLRHNDSVKLLVAQGLLGVGPSGMDGIPSPTNIIIVESIIS